MMRRIVLLVGAALVMTAVILVMASGVALAVAKFGGPGNDRLTGTNGPDQLLGGSGNDSIDGLRGPDQLLGGSGDDLLFDGENRGGAQDILVGGSGNDVLFPGQFARPVGDIVVCGGGYDVVFPDRRDLVAPDCEEVQFV
jgi:hypothetical protein